MLNIKKLHLKTYN